MLSFLYVYSDHSILECYNLFSGVELSMRSFFVISMSAAQDKSAFSLVATALISHYKYFVRYILKADLSCAALIENGYPPAI